MRRTRRLVGALALFAAVASGCGSDGPDRPSVLADLADTSILPAYDDLAADTGSLHDATVALCDDPTPDTLAAARVAWTEARGAWSFSEPMWVGPVMDRRSWAVIDWPISIDEIEELIADETVELDLDRLSRRIGADQRGLGAVEYILFEPFDDTVVDALADPQRCQYLTGIAEVIAQEAALLPDDWRIDFEDGGPYRSTFTAADGDGLDSVVNDVAFLLEAMADAELGVALGEMERDTDPEAIHEGAAGLGVAQLQDHLGGLRAVLVGESGDGTAGGLGPLLGGDLTDRLVEQFDAADAALAAVPDPLRTAVAEATATVSAARAALKEIQTTVLTEVVSRLGVTIGFSDADGDSG